MMKEVDLDKDGEISFKEFKSVMSGLKKSLVLTEEEKTKKELLEQKKQEEKDKKE